MIVGNVILIILCSAFLIFGIIGIGVWLAKQENEKLD